MNKDPEAVTVVPVIASSARLAPITAPSSPTSASPMGASWKALRKRSSLICSSFFFWWSSMNTPTFERNTVGSKGLKR